MLDPRRLQLLAEVGRQGSIAAAAHALGRTAAGVSQQLALLEREAGVSLLDRGARSVRLTPAGARLAAVADELTSLLDGAEREMAAFGTLAAGQVTLGAFPTAAAALVPAAIAAFSRRHPGVEVRLVEAEPAELEQLVARGAADIAITYTYALVERERALPRGLESRPLVDEPVLAALPATRAWPAEVALRRLARDRWIAPRDDMAGAEHLRRACVAAGFEPDIRVRTNDYLVVQALIGAGLGIALVPRMAVRRTRGVVVRPVRGAGLVREIALLVAITNGNPAVPPMIAALERAAGTAAGSPN
jgi:DNA-binding transcriptional LysR family regulator